MTDKKTLDTFVRLSASLTGFPPSTIAPILDPINLKQLYYDKMSTEMPSQLEQMSSIYEEIVGTQPLTQDLAQQVADAVLAEPTLKDAVQALLKLWYLGSWWIQASGDTESDFQTILTQEAYTNSLVWRTIQAHPMGYSTFHYGYWGEQPPTLDDFIGKWAKNQQENQS